jgi:predicted DNA-binding transcriptional regulator YafY
MFGVCMHKYIGHTVDIIYLSRTGKITQRRIQVWSVHGGIVKGFCLEQQGPRVFRTENILAVQPVVRTA